MSATHYTLRTCPTHAGVAAQQGTVQTPNIGTNLLGSQECSNVMAVTLEPHMSNAHVIEGVACSYSNIATSQPSSPASAIGEESPSGDAETLARSARVEETLVTKTEVVSQNNTKNIVANYESHESDTSLLSDMSELDDNQNPWTTVVHRHSRSLDSLTKNKKTVKKVKLVQNRVNSLTAEQDTVVNEAEKQLTSVQKEQLSHRYKKVQKKMAPHDRSESQGEGPSNSKGKGADPCNWGGVQLSDTELDINAQCVALESFAVEHDKIPESEDSAKKNPKKVLNTHQGNSKPSKTPSSTTLEQSTCPVKKDKDHHKALLVKAA